MSSSILPHRVARWALMVIFFLIALGLATGPSIAQPPSPPSPVPVIPPPPTSPASLLGAGIIDAPLANKTVRSPADFGLAVGPDGGSFVYSTVAGAFRGMSAFIVRGWVERGSLQVTGAAVVFRGRATVLRIGPGPRPSVRTLSGVPFSVTVTVGGPVSGTLILRLSPALTEEFGGYLGGVVKVGRIDLE